MKSRYLIFKSLFRLIFLAIILFSLSTNLIFSKNHLSFKSFNPLNDIFVMAFWFFWKFNKFIIKGFLPISTDPLNLIN